MTTKAKKEINLNENLKKLADISAWFNSQKEIDLETGLEKVKEAAALIKDSREKLANLENEFKEIEKEFSEEANEADLKSNFPM
jgi:predicted  nucleic acid-binding Zn-ribbon protein